MSDLVEHAHDELTRAGLFDDDADYHGAHALAVMHLIELFAAQGHSGASAALTLDLFTRLARFEPLTPITSDPAEWIDQSAISGGPLWQNRRRSTSFSRDGGQTWYDIEDESQNNGDVWRLCAPVPDEEATVSNLEHVTGTAFVAADEAQYLKWLDGAAGEQKRLEARVNRLINLVVAYHLMVLCLWEYVDGEPGPALHEAKEAFIKAQHGMQQGDLVPMD